MRLLLFAIPFLLFIQCSGDQQVRTIKLGHTLDRTHSVHLAMEFMARDLEKRSNGTMTLEIYPSGQLGSEREMVELLQIGSLGMAKVSAAVMEGFIPSYQVLGLPYIFRDRDHAFAVMDGPIGKKILNDGLKFRLKGLCFYDAGSRSFYTKERPIKEPEDLGGLKIRVMKSKTAVQMVNELGGAATPISWGELYTSLQQGVVDGAENNPPSFYLSRHYEVCKYYSLNEHTSVPDVLLIGTYIWNRLSQQEQEWLTASVEASVPYQHKEWQKSEQESLDAVRAAGVEVIVPDKKPFMQELSGIFDSYRSDPPIYQLIQEIQAVNPNHEEEN